MNVNPKLNEIDDCLYRVATKGMIVQDGKLPLVKELPEMWWGFPGGGVDHGETVESSLVREVEEEVGDPRMNLFFKVSPSKDLVKKTDEVAEPGWFTRDEFMELYMSPSYADRQQLADVIFDMS